MKLGALGRIQATKLGFLLFGLLGKRLEVPFAQGTQRPLSFPLQSKRGFLFSVREISYSPNSVIHNGFGIWGKQNLENPATKLL